MRTALRTTAAAVVLVLAACGSSDPGVSAGAARSLHAEIAALRTAAASRNRTTTAAQADRIALLIAHLRDMDAIDASAARRLRRALDTVRSRVNLLPAPTTTTTTTTTTSVPEPEHDHGKGHRKERGKKDD